MANRSKPRITAGLDVGSSRTRCVVCQLEDGRIRFLGAGSAPSAGWSRGRLAEPQAASESIRAAVQDAEARAKTLVESVTVGIGGPGIEAEQGRGIYQFPRRHEITEADLKYAFNRACRAPIGEGRILLHVLQQDFTIDGRAGFKNPVGSACTQVESNVLLLTASQQEHELLVSAVHQAHLLVEDTVYEPMAAAYAAILPEERARGAAVLDLGVDSTGLVVYDGDAAVWAVNIPVTSDHLTRDIVMGLQQVYGIMVNYEDAEILKRDYGCAMLGLTSDNSMIAVPSSDNRQMHELPRQQLNDILDARAEQLFRYVRKELEGCGMARALMEGIHLTGGGARMTGMLDMAERQLNCLAKYGLARGIINWPQDFVEPAWTTAAGLAMYSARWKQKRKPRRAPGFLGLLGWEGGNRTPGESRWG